VIEHRACDVIVPLSDTSRPVALSHRCDSMRHMRQRAERATQDSTSAPSEFQNSTPNKPAIATVPEAATDTPGVPSPQTTGEAPNVSKKMGAEMESAGDIA